MANGAPLPVREYASAEENRRHAAEVHARIWGATPRVKPHLRVEAQPAALAADLSAREMVEPGFAKPVERDAFVERTLAEYGAVILPETREQRDGRASLRGTGCLKLVARITGYSAAAMQGPSRVSGLVKARQIAIWLMVNRAGKSLLEAGWLMGGRDHTTARHACRRVKAMMADAGIADQDDIEDLIVRLWSAVGPPRCDADATAAEARPC